MMFLDLGTQAKDGTFRVPEPQERISLQLHDDRWTFSVVRSYKSCDQHEACTGDYVYMSSSVA